MTQEHRIPVHIDISGSEQVTAAKGAKITGTRWDPNKGAREAQQRVEEAVREEHQREQDRVAQDPTQRRLVALEDQYKSLAAAHKKLQTRIAALESK